MESIIDPQEFPDIVKFPKIKITEEKLTFEVNFGDLVDTQSSKGDYKYEAFGYIEDLKNPKMMKLLHMGPNCNEKWTKISELTKICFYNF